MASFEDHIYQAKRNLEFLSCINKIKGGIYWDWQVTTLFYVGVHLINAHISNKTNKHYRSHKAVTEAINPRSNKLSLAKLPEDCFVSYKHLSNLSRRSRYLIHDAESNITEDAHFTFDKHFKKGVKHLDIVISYISSEYKIPFDKYEIECIELKNYTSEIFVVK